MGSVRAGDQGHGSSDRVCLDIGGEQTGLTGKGLGVGGEKSGREPRSWATAPGQMVMPLLEQAEGSLAGFWPGSVCCQSTSRGGASQDPVGC